MGDYTIEECMKGAQPLLDRGHTIHQKYTCEGCGSRQTMETPNVFFTSGKCEECGHITDIEKSGCNYLMISRFRVSQTKGK